MRRGVSVATHREPSTKSVLRSGAHNDETITETTKMFAVKKRCLHHIWEIKSLTALYTIYETIPIAWYGSKKSIYEIITINGVTIFF